MSFLTALPQTLRALREHTGMPRDLVAETACRHGKSLTEARIRQWERGEAVPTLESLDALLDALEVSPLEVLAVAWAVERGRRREGEGREPSKAALLDRQLRQLLGAVAPEVATNARSMRLLRSARSAVAVHQLLAEEDRRLSGLLEAIYGDASETFGRRPLG